MVLTRRAPSATAPGQEEANSTLLAAEWELEELPFEGEIYLLDRHTGLVYLPPEGEDDYPEGPVGHWDGRSITFRDTSPASEMFHAIDAYLRDNRVRFKRLFEEADANGDGALDEDELAALVHKFLPAASPADLDYFKVRPRPAPRLSGGANSALLQRLGDVRCAAAPRCAANAWQGGALASGPLALRGWLVLHVTARQGGRWRCGLRLDPGLAGLTPAAYAAGDD